MSASVTLMHTRLGRPVVTADDHERVVEHMRAMIGSMNVELLEQNATIRAQATMIVALEDEINRLEAGEEGE